MHLKHHKTRVIEDEPWDSYYQRLQYQHEGKICLEGPGKSYILDFDRVKNGCGNHYEGDSFCYRSKEEAYTVLDHLHYEAEQKESTFEKFVEKHNDCYLVLSHHNEPIYEEKKVQNFPNCIYAPELQAAKQ